MRERLVQVAVMRLSAQINCGDLRAFVPELAADCVASQLIAGVLVGCKYSNGWPARDWSFPASQGLVSRLRIKMPQSVHVAQAGGLALSVIGVALLDVSLVSGDH